MLREPRNLLLGVTDEQYDNGRLTLAPGEGLVVVTGGITESLGQDGQLFGPDRLAALLRSQAPRSGQEVVTAVVKAAADYRHPLGQQDDITVLALVRPTAGGAG